MKRLGWVKGLASVKKLVWVWSWAALLLGPAVVTPAAAQVGQVWVEPRAGWVLPTRDLGRTDVIGGSGYGVFEQANAGLSVGVGVGVGITDAWALRLSGDRTSDLAVSGEWRCAPFVACPSVLLPLDGELDRWSMGLDVMYRPALGLPVEPTLFGGLAVRQSSLTWDPPAADLTLPALGFEERGVLYRLGVGVQRAIGAATAFAEVEASTSRFGGAPYRSVEGGLEADHQAALDIGLIGGIRVRVR
jgi:hypothetical protein